MAAAIPTTDHAPSARDKHVQLLHFLLPAHDWVPNHPRFPVLLYRQALPPSTSNLGAAFEARLNTNGWPAQWCDGIFDYHHYHSSAHEALAVSEGSAEVILGGPGGKLLALETGDLLVLPAGTGHCLKSASEDFQVVGAYPQGQDWDICRSAPSAAQRAAIHAVPRPLQDPLDGSEGPLCVLWRA